MNPNDLENVKCEECGATTFTQVFSMKKIPALLSGTGQEAYVPIIDAFKCTECGHVNSEFKKEEKEEEPKPNIIMPGQ